MMMVVCLADPNVGAFVGDNPNEHHQKHLSFGFKLCRKLLQHEENDAGAAKNEGKDRSIRDSPEE